MPEYHVTWAIIWMALKGDRLAINILGYSTAQYMDQHYPWIAQLAPYLWVAALVISIAAYALLLLSRRRRAHWRALNALPFRYHRPLKRR